MADTPHRSVSEADGRHWLTIPPDVHHGRRTSPLGDPDDGWARAVTTAQFAKRRIS